MSCLYKRINIDWWKFLMRRSGVNQILVIYEEIPFIYKMTTFFKIMQRAEINFILLVYVELVS